MNGDGSGIGLPAGTAMRTASADDAGAIAEVVAASELAANGTVDVDREDVLTDLTPPLLASPDHAVVVEDGGAVVAASILHTNTGSVSADVRPAYRGRGIGASLLAWSERTAADAGVDVVGQVVAEGDASARALLAAAGYEPRWTSWLLEYPVPAGGVPPPAVPDGITLRPYEHDDATAVHRLIQDAFNEWEGHVDQPLEQWRVFSVGRETFEPRLSPVALDGDEIVGVALSLVYDEEEGYVHQLAVRRSHRNRGIARALLQSAFRAFGELGRRTVTLGTESRTGALPMYERIGMRVRRSYTNVAKRLETPGVSAPGGPGSGPPSS